MEAQKLDLLAERVAKAVELIARLQRENGDYQHTLSEERSKLISFDEQRQALEGRVAELESELERSQQEGGVAEDLRRSLFDSQQRVSGLEVELRDAETAHTEECARLVAEAGELQSALRGRDDRLDLVSGRLEQMLGVIDALAEEENADGSREEESGEGEDSEGSDEWGSEEEEAAGEDSEDSEEQNDEELFEEEHSAEASEEEGKSEPLTMEFGIDSIERFARPDEGEGPFSSSSSDDSPPEEQEGFRFE